MSDLLIRGMEMPAGGYRTLEIAFDADGHPMALADGGDVFDVIPVPACGRLIDADEIIADLDEVSRRVFGDDDIPECSSLSVVRDYVEQAPTIIPASEDVFR